MPGDESEEFDQAALPGRAHAKRKARQMRSEDSRGTRHVGGRAHEGWPCEQVGFRVLRRTTVPKRILDQAAWINPGAIEVGPCSAAP